MRSVTVASAADYLITHHPAGANGSGPLVITFGGQPSKLTPSGFGTGFALANGWDSIYVAQREGTQYQGLDRETFAEAVAPLARGRDVVCYGSSLGAYAALYFGGSIDARIIAAAPMLPAWPPLQRPAQDQMPVAHGPIADGPLSSCPPVVIYDPEVRHDQMVLDGLVLPAYPAARLLRLCSVTAIFAEFDTDICSTTILRSGSLRGGGEAPFTSSPEPALQGGDLCVGCGGPPNADEAGRLQPASTSNSCASHALAFKTVFQRLPG